MAQKDSRFIVGIDLGTTHTVVAYVDTRREGAPIQIFDVEQLVAPGEVEARPLLHSLRYHAGESELSAEDRALPWQESAIDGVPEGVTGELARTLGAKVPGRLVASAKSWLSHPSVDRTAAILPWGAPSEVPKVSPVGASASYLSHLRHAWNQRFPKEPLEKQSVVLTVPASFDEGARTLTLRAARLAGLGAVRLLEEPQAAFYDWLGRHDAELEERVKAMHLALVVDVGGGTTDLTLVQVELRESGPRLTRVAVGDHLMLGGDNMDLALAHDVEAKLGGKEKLAAARFTQLLQQCRGAKEELLAHGAPEKVNVTVLGGGSKLVGGSRSAELTRDEVHRRIVDGFFPFVEPDARPERKRGAIVEFGLPYVADPAITRHIAAFLDRHRNEAREAFPEGEHAQGAFVVPDAVLLNGGVFNGEVVTERLLEVLGRWRGAPLERLSNPSPELAVARGAVAYGLARRGVGVRIGGGSARSFYLVVGNPDEKPRRAVCLLPRGAEEGEEVVLKTRTFALQLGQPVRFSLASSTGEAVLHRAGDLVELEGGGFEELPPLAAVLEDESGESKAVKIPVRIATALTEVGTVELSCIAAEGKPRRWKLELQLRGEGAGAAGAPTKVTQLHPRFAEATELVKNVFGKASAELEGNRRPVKTLRADLEKTVGPRDTWNVPLLRELFGALLGGAKRRRRSVDHERVWFNLVGYSLRPGFGYPLDDWRVKQVAALFDAGVEFVPEAQNWSEWWTMWRRISGGLDEAMQVRILDALAFYLHPPTPRPRPRPKGPKMLGYDDMVRLAASLERVPAERKVEVGGWLVERLTKHGEGDVAWWALGRLGARVPFFGSAHNVVPRVVAEQWLGHVLAVDWKKVDPAAFAATQLSRMSGDRERDLSEEAREAVAKRLEKHGAAPSWVKMVREVAAMEAADAKRVFGESLPAGLSLLE